MAIYAPLNEARTKAEYEKEKADRAAAEKAKEKERDSRRYGNQTTGDKKKDVFDDLNRSISSGVSTVDEDLNRQDKGLKPFSDKDKKVVEDKFNKRYRKYRKSSRGIFESVRLI